MFGYEEFAVIRKEAAVIKAAPFSFFVVLLVIGGLMWTGFHISYKGKLEDAHELTEHWKGESDHWQSDSAYWKDIATHPVQVNPTHQPAPPPTTQEPKPKQKPEIPSTNSPAGKHESNSPDHVGPGPNVSAPNGVAIGRDNNGTAIVNNGSIPRTLTAEQVQKIVSQVGTGSPSFTGITCLLGDQEGCALAEQIGQSLNNAGWQIPGVIQAVMNKPVAGLFVVISPEDAASPPDGTMRLYAALRAAGLNVIGIKQQGAPQGKFALLVGANPPPR
jgi:hypothetical protein